jgi:hypothetical protein
MLGIVAAAVAFGAVAKADYGKGDGKCRLGKPGIQWVNHFDLLSGDPMVTSTSANSTTSGVGGGLTGLVITSNKLGNTDSFNGNKVVQMALELHKDTRIKGVRLCYELSDPGSSGTYIDDIRLAQIQNPPATALVVLEDPTAQDASGPICVNSAPPFSGPVDSRNGSVLLSFRIETGNTADLIVIRAVGLLVE